MSASSYSDLVQQLYVAYFGRPADPQGLSSWAALVDAKQGNFSDVIAGFSASAESAALYAGSSSAQLVASIYLNLFHRAPEPAGLAYWVGLIGSGAVSPAAAAFTLMQSALGSDATSVANKLTAANAFTALIDTAQEAAGYAGANAALLGRIFLQGVDAAPASLASALSANTLQTAMAMATGTYVPPQESAPPIDPLIVVAAGGTFSGRQGVVDIFQSTIANLNITTIAGNATDTDVLTLTTAGTVTLNNGATGGTISNIKVLNLANGTNTITYNNAAGFTRINGGTGDDTFIPNVALFPIVVNGGDGTDTLVLTATYAATASGSGTFATNVTGFEKLRLTSVTNQTIDLQTLGNYNDVTLSGGPNGLTLANLASNGNVALTGAGTALTISNAAFAGGINDIVNVSLSDNSGAGVSFATVGISASGVETANISINDNQGASSGSFNDSLTWLGNSVKTINISGNAGLTLTANSTALTTVNASGITLGGFTWTSNALTGAVTVKGSATGTNTVDLNAATVAASYTGGTGNDNLTIKGTLANTVDLGSGNNSLTLSNSNIIGSYIAGSGTNDTLTLTSTTPDLRAYMDAPNKPSPHSLLPRR